MDQIRVNKGGSGGSARIVSDDAPMAPKKVGSKLPWVILVVVILLVAAGVLFRDRISSMWGGGKDSGVQAQEKVSEYHAVFLDNNQVYFGKLSEANTQYLLLTDIYYLQVKQDTTIQGQGTQNTQPKTEVSLVKLGKELHGPTDEMWINRDKVLFYEEMKEDSEVVKAIKDHKADPTGANRNSQQQSQVQTQQQNTTTNSGSTQQNTTNRNGTNSSSGSNSNQ